VLQAAPTGFSARVDTRGGVTGRTDLGAPAVLIETLPRRVGTTPYQRTGDVPWLILTVLCAAAALILEHARHDRS
jgi:apolipoprotein N-acyltransferase